MSALIEEVSLIEYHCTVCNSIFTSRNKLFKHIKQCSTTSSSSSSNIDDKTITSCDSELQEYLQNNNDKDIVIYISGGRVRGRTLKSVECYSFRSNKWELLKTSMRYHRGSHGMVSIGKDLYVIGGGGLESNISNCEKYNTITDEWISIAATPSCRHALSVVKTPSAIYALGGFVDGSQNSATCERYDIDKNEWSICASMKVARRLLGVCYHGDDHSIYTFGGSIDDGEWYTNSVECYNIATDTWSHKKKLPLQGPTSVISINGYMYIFVHGKKVLKYNPVSDEYEEKCNLPLNDWNCFTITSFNNLVFLTGGATKLTYQSFWIYNTSTNQWKEMPSMIKQRRRAAASLMLL